MDVIDDIFLNEDLSKPENRINVSMFGLMTQDWFREWLLEKLGQPRNSIVYPATTGLEVRPDLKVADPANRSTLAWIEVERATDSEQVSRFRERLSEPVYTIWGREGDGGNLSLEGVAEFLDERMRGDQLSPQVLANVRHLSGLIEIGLYGYRPLSKRVEVSDDMKNHWMVRALCGSLGDTLGFELGKIGPGEIKANTLGSGGFSLRVFSRVSSSGEVSIMHITAGRDEICFSSRQHLEKYLPNHTAEIGSYADTLRAMGCDIESPSGRERKIHTEADKERLERHIDELARCLVALARRPF